MTPIDTAKQAIESALALLPDRMTSNPARVLLVAIGLQESRLTHRRQIRGPARGLPQFELNGVRGVLRHAATQRHAEALCLARDIAPIAQDIHEAMEHDDVLAFGFARLNLWRLPAPLPRIGDEAGAWAQYIEAWRPGKPHPERWPTNYRAALEAYSHGR